MEPRELWRRLHRERTVSLHARLRETFTVLRAPLEGGSEGELERRPAPGSWSALEILEHVSLANAYLLLLVEKIRRKSLRRLERGEPWPTGPPAGDSLSAVARDRSPWPHPAHMAPTGRIAAPVVSARLGEGLARCEAVLAEMPEGQGTLHRIRMSRVGMRLDLYQYVDFLGRHAERHARQLTEALGASHHHPQPPRA